MITSAYDAARPRSRRRRVSGASLQGGQAEPNEFNFLSFLAKAQALRIEFLPIVWDTERNYIALGGTAILEQALITVDTSLAFKTYREQSGARKSEEFFETLINEITILSQPFMRQHANIAGLQGICWEIIPEEDWPWPVLIFEKSHLGDLDFFFNAVEREVTIDDRLEIFADIASAIIAMHAHGK